MSRYSNIEIERKKQQAKELYIKLFDIQTIAEIIQITPATVTRWAKDNDFETARKSKSISLSELRSAILDSFSELREGKKPKIKPDEAAKYASAFEKLSDKKKTLSYMYEAFEMLTDELSKEVQNASTKKDKETSLSVLKIVRTKTDAILTKLTSDVLNDI
jgi:hypothetical protein